MHQVERLPAHRRTHARERGRLGRSGATLSVLGAAGVLSTVRASGAVSIPRAASNPGNAVGRRLLASRHRRGLTGSHRVLHAADAAREHVRHAQEVDKVGRLQAADAKAGLQFVTHLMGQEQSLVYSPQGATRMQSTAGTKLCC